MTSSETYVPSLSLELVYDKTKQEVVRTSFWLGPNKGETICFLNQLTRDFDAITENVQHVCSETFFYKMEMARQAGRAGVNPNWAIKSIKASLKSAANIPKGAYQSLPLPDDHPNFQKIVLVWSGKYRQKIYKENATLPKPPNSLETIEFDQLCNNFHASLDQFCKSALLLNEEDSNDLTALNKAEDEVLVHQYHLATLINFYTHIVPKTKSPNDLRQLVDSCECTWEVVDDDVNPPVNLSHKLIRTRARQDLRFFKSNNE